MHPIASDIVTFVGKCAALVAIAAIGLAWLFTPAQRQTLDGETA
jgi:hypothetical protein